MICIEEQKMIKEKLKEVYITKNKLHKSNLLHSF